MSDPIKTPIGALRPTPGKPAPAPFEGQEQWQAARWEPHSFEPVWGASRKVRRGDGDKHDVSLTYQESQQGGGDG